MTHHPPPPPLSLSSNTHKHERETHRRQASDVMVVTETVSEEPIGLERLTEEDLVYVSFHPPPHPHYRHHYSPYQKHEE